MSLTTQPEVCNVNVSNMEDMIEQAARRTAINLMRLNEAIDHRDAEGYSMRPDSNGYSAKYHRHGSLNFFYKQWFLNVAWEPEAAEEVKLGSAPTDTNMEDSK